MENYTIISYEPATIDDIKSHWDDFGRYCWLNKKQYIANGRYRNILCKSWSLNEELWQSLDSTVNPEHITDAGLECFVKVIIKYHDYDKHITVVGYDVNKLVEFMIDKKLRLKNTSGWGYITASSKKDNWTIHMFDDRESD